VLEVPKGVLVAYYGAGMEISLTTAFTAIVMVMFCTRPKSNLTGKAHLKALGKLLVGDIGRVRIRNTNPTRRWHRWPVHGIPLGLAWERKRGMSLVTLTQPTDFDPSISQRPSDGSGFAFGHLMRTSLLGGILGSLAGAILGLAVAFVTIVLGGALDDRVWWAEICVGVPGMLGLLAGVFAGATESVIGGRPTRTILVVGLAAAISGLAGRLTEWSNPMGRQFAFAVFGAALAMLTLKLMNRRTTNSSGALMPLSGRWFQFSLRSLMVLLVLICVGIGFLVSLPMKRQWAVAALENHGARLKSQPRAPTWLDQIFGSQLPRVFDRVAEVSRVHSNDDLVLLTALPDVENLQLNDARITDAGLAHLAGHSQLKVLSLAGSSVTDAGLLHLRTLTGLEDLSLDGLAISDSGIESIARNVRLKRLSLRNTKLTDAGLLHLVRLTHLEELFLDNVDVTDKGVAHLAPLTNLEFLSVDGTLVGDAGLVHVSGMPHMRKLSLFQTNVSDQGLAHLRSLKLLEALWLGETSVTGEGFKQMAPCERLDSLYLQDTLISDAGLEPITKFRKLFLLDLSGTQITDVGLAELVVLPKLGNLRLGATQITDTGLERLEGLSRLENVETTGTSVSAEGLERLHNAVQQNRDRSSPGRSP
jgi:Leucine-rich repeat (LRR) protein